MFGGTWVRFGESVLSPWPTATAVLNVRCLFRTADYAVLVYGQDASLYSIN
uniref:Uncharacterized protein n=1 Tax=Arundo donax TaxID=35708 RepID=A0A0A8Y6W9_ARUDO